MNEIKQIIDLPAPDQALDFFTEEQELEIFDQLEALRMATYQEVQSALTSNKRIDPKQISHFMMSQFLNRRIRLEENIQKNFAASGGKGSLVGSTLTGLKRPPASFKAKSFSAKFYMGYEGKKRKRRLTLYSKKVNEKKPDQVPEEESQRRYQILEDSLKHNLSKEEFAILHAIVGQYLGFDLPELAERLGIKHYHAHKIIHKLNSQILARHNCQIYVRNKIAILGPLESGQKIDLFVNNQTKQNYIEREQLFTKIEALWNQKDSLSIPHQIKEETPPAPTPPPKTQEKKKKKEKKKAEKKSQPPRSPWRKNITPKALGFDPHQEYEVDPQRALKLKIKLHGIIGETLYVIHPPNNLFSNRKHALSQEEQQDIETFEQALRTLQPDSTEVIVSVASMGGRFSKADARTLKPRIRIDPQKDPLEYILAELKKRERFAKSS